MRAGAFCADARLSPQAGQIGDTIMKRHRTDRFVVLAT